MKIKPSLAFSMVEVIVAAVVFTVAAVGVLAAISRARHPVGDADHRLQAAAYGKQILDRLRADISVDSWSGDDWQGGAKNPHWLPADSNFLGYNAHYNVTDDALGGKQISLNISW